MKKMIVFFMLAVMVMGCMSSGAPREPAGGKGPETAGTSAPAPARGNSPDQDRTVPGTSPRNSGGEAKTARPAAVRTAPTQTDAELVAAAIRQGNCAFLYAYTQREGAERPLVTQANNAIRMYSGADGGTGRYRTNRMEARVRRVPAALMEQVFVDPAAALPGVVASLTGGMTDSFLKVKTLHDWICDNIAYDTAMYFSGRVSAQDYISVLKKKKAVCSGYTNVMNQMCSLAGIESIGINGYSKGFGYTGSIGNNPDHAWNAVHIGNKWHLVDVTWDAGPVERRTFIKRYSTAWLFLDSRPFLYSHLPADDAYQYYAPVLTPADFMREAYIPGAFFRYGLALKAEDPEYNNLIDGGFTFDLVMRSGNVLLSSELRTPGQQEVEGASWTERKGTAVTFDFDVPDAGEYRGHIFARFTNAETPVERIDIGTFERDWLPRAEALFNTENPGNRKISAGELEYFRNSYYKVADNGCYYFLEDQFDAARNTAVMKIHRLLDLPTDMLENVLDFNIRAAPGYRGFGRGIVKYPAAFSAYGNAANTQLLSPVKGVLTSGETERFVVSSRDFTRVAIIINGEFTPLEKNSRTGNFEADFEIPAGITELAVYGSKDGRQYTGLLRYRVVQ
ncbi:MAG: hypothetical protein LBC88_01610 [Spirochaetaceae bacterium]|jgi:hypothetical protein|nr:hypothetical protein [Spirochaetaceae bacterium]